MSFYAQQKYILTSYEARYSLRFITHRSTLSKSIIYKQDPQFSAQNSWAFADEKEMKTFNYAKNQTQMTPGFLS